MSNVLETSDLRKTFGDLVAVDGVGFSIAPGETYGLLGPNGAGKTTTISIIAGLLEADQGVVSLGGEPMSPSAVGPKRRMGLVPRTSPSIPISPRERICTSLVVSTGCRRTK